MSQILLDVQSLCAGYDKAYVVEDVSLNVKSGEVYGLVGLNGAGKTTLIKTILGLREKRAGEIKLSRKDVAYLPEKFEPPWFLTGYKFIKFSLKLYGKNISNDEITQAAETVSLDPACLDKNVKTYSKGMRQKLGLLATILTDCPLLILDEPMSGLDPKARLEVKKIIHSLRHAGRSVFMSSHVLADVEELCDRVAVFHNKNIIFEGPPSALLTRGGSDNAEEAFLNMLNVA